MARLRLITEPNELLRKRSKEVDAPSARLNELLDDMRETMIANEGVGIAAVQVGTMWRVFLVDIAKQGIVEFINPVIVKFSQETKVGDEGCLSVSGRSGRVARAKQVTIEALDRNFNKFTLELSGRDAIVVAHELDHLDGILFIDKIHKPE
jgi:peptide deformylase